MAERFKEKDDAEKILVRLSEIQLRFEAPVSDIYRNLIAVAQRTKQPEIITHCEKMQKFYIGSRVMNERFPLRKDLF
ncbi:hypothetical protein [Serratia microhaemolytica]|uniref:hypothetical protein n=1 Tax=Serratia microhaemolytica TaxID=2675110 RepID=UPI000FDE6281|nr:hypothetical protein [Serratia microhaemolytica]